MSTGSINAYTKNLKLQMQWELKQRQGDFSSHKAPSPDGSCQEEDEEQSKQRLRGIQQKVFAGQKLTTQERLYLQTQDPDSYAQLEANEREQRIYQQRLKMCRTKEEVQRLKMCYVGSSLSQLRAIERDASLSKEEKMKRMVGQLERCDLLNKSANDYYRRGEYSQLPNEAEQAKARKEEAQARRLPRRSKKKYTVKRKTTTVTRDRNGKKKVVREKKERTRREEKKPMFKPESPELRKYRRARAKAAYAAATATEPAALLRCPCMDLKI